MMSFLDDVIGQLLSVKLNMDTGHIFWVFQININQLQNIHTDMYDMHWYVYSKENGV